MAFQLTGGKQQSGAEATPSNLPLLSWDELSARPAPRWLVKNLIPEKSLTLLYGAPGSMKSFLALDIAAHIASGQEFWHGHRLSRKGQQPLVVYVAAEGGGGLSKRSRGWKIAHPGVRPNVRFVLNPLELTPESEDFKALVAVLDGEMTAHRDDPDNYPEHDEETGDLVETLIPPALIVIDTLARCFVGNENEQEAMKLFIDACEILRTQCHCSVLVIHHTGKDEKGKERGSSALFGAIDVKLKVKVAGNGQQAVILETQKQKDSEAASPLTLEWMKVPLPLLPGEVQDPEDVGNEMANSTAVFHASHQDADSVDGEQLTTFSRKKEPGARERVVEHLASLPVGTWVTLSQLEKDLPGVGIEVYASCLDALVAMRSS